MLIFFIPLQETHKYDTTKFYIENPFRPSLKETDTTMVSPLPVSRRSDGHRLSNHKPYLI